MSRTFTLICRETKQRIWVGQGRKTMAVFYSGEPETMARLGRFLEATRGKQLQLVDDEMVDVDEYEEFERPDEVP